MARQLPDIDRLIEEGLTLYGQGDLDGALLVWEQALALDPENAQANSYVDYVRLNYQLLTDEVNGTTESAPFGIASDEDEYQIEILPGELEPGEPAPLYMDPADEGWFFDQEKGPELRDSESGHMTLELEADEPADPAPQEPAFDPPGTFELEADEPPGFERPNTFEPPGTFEPAVPDGGGISFEDATREYPGGPPAKAETLADFDSAPEPVTSEFNSEATPGFGMPSDYQTPPGFNMQTTDVRKLDLGFVRPAGEPREERKRSAGPPELKMTLRTPAHADEPGLELAPPATQRSPLEPSDDADSEPPTIDRGQPEPAAPEDDLISSLPSPRPAPRPAPRAPTGRTNTEPYAGIDVSEPLEPPPDRPSEPLITVIPAAPPTTTRDLPSPTRPPAFAAPATEAAAEPAPESATEQPAEPLTPSPTVDFSQQLTPSVPYEPGPAVNVSVTRDFEVVTKRRPGAALPPSGNAEPSPLVSAPTRDLGLRQRASTEDEPTAQARILDLKRPDTMFDPEAATRADAALPFDPIDARSAQILDEIDENAPSEEEREDRTRRRITTLFEKAGDWGRDGDFERAVAAVDLALSGDPNSALAQKLIHRNRDTIMNVFQAFLGDLQRQPQLARPLHELASAPISPRAAFLLSRVDGQLTLDEILDVSGMPRLEAYRYLCQLYLRGILR